MPSSQQNDWKELAVREGDGLEISLHWSTSTDRVKVSVLDQRHDESFDIHVAKRASAQRLLPPVCARR